MKFKTPEKEKLFGSTPLFEDEWREIMSNFAFYSKYYKEKPLF